MTAPEHYSEPEVRFRAPNPVSREFESLRHFYGLATQPSSAESVNPSPLPAFQPILNLPTQV